ncbi:winged helix-turn-helix transcriptional regulator [Streptomyces nondiastaticus]|uniref:Winged helix-turn-helix transcriptional regulator n=1 Tax=Streptomyces nondiastaticus TaxID=3154512 RepID=A0ABW6TU64_9ACTN
MTATTFMSPTSRINDLQRVEESLAVIAPRWSVWTLQTLQQTGRLRYHEVREKLPWLKDPAVSQRLAALADHGLVDRTATDGRPVYYALTDRGRELAPAQNALAAWADACLEDTGPTARAEQVEDALKLITPRHATAVLWALQINGPMRSGELAREVAPGLSPMVITSRLRQLGADGLVERVTDNHRSSYQLTAAARALGPTYTALSAWAAGRPPTTAHHPVWAPAQAADRAQDGQARRSVAAAAVATSPRTTPAITAQRTPPSWRQNDLFSHTTRHVPTVPAQAMSGRSR